MTEPQAPSQGNEPQAPQEPVAPQQQAPTPEPQAQAPNPQEPQVPLASAEGEPAAPVERVVPAADGYKFEEGTPEQLGAIFNQLDMTQAQAEGVIKLEAVRTQAQNEALATAGKAHIASWGDAAETNMNLAKRGLDSFDPTGQLKNILNETGFGNDPRLIEMFYQFGQRMEEGGFLTSSVNTPQGKSKEVSHMWYPNDVPKANNKS